MYTLINDGWYFTKLASGSTLSDAENAVFTSVDIPHDWLIWQEQNLYESSDAWYFRDIEIAEEHEPVIMIRFDGVYMDCDVLLNGKVIASHPYGYTSFYVPLTEELRIGMNRLMVHIRHQSPNSRWYSGSGIYRDVCLITMPEDYIIPDSLYFSEAKSGINWILKITAETGGKGEQPFSCTLFSQDGAISAKAEGRTQDGKAYAVMTIPHGREWSPNDPYLYRIEIRYGLHTEVRRIGLRSVFIHPEKGLLLNGEHIKLKGVCLHHDLGALGSAFHEKAARRQLSLMKDMGANAVRTSHNPPASKFLDLCDEMGFLVVDEAFDMWERPKTTYDYARFFRERYQEDVSAWICRDRCHPCVIMWSIGNEIYDMHADLRGTIVTERLAELVRIHDPSFHAFVTFGCNYMAWEGGQRCAEYVDAVGYNYSEKLYEIHHREHPSWVIYGSETSSVLSSRGIYHFPIEQSIMSDADEQCSSLGNSNTSWGAEHLTKMIVDDIQCTYSLGQFIWSGIDYIGEPTPYHTRSCYFGQADTACFPKDAYYLFQSLWTEKKMIHIGVSWDWNDQQIIDVPVMSNCSEVELFLNNSSLGRKQVNPNIPEQCLSLWKLPFTAGRLEARGFNENGMVICKDTRITPGDTDHLTLACENEYLLADGWDLAFVTVTAEDAYGRPVENARDRIKVSVTGGGRLLGTDNGDSTDPDGYKSDCRRLFSGKLLLIIGSNGDKQNAVVHISSQGKRNAEMIIPVRDASRIPGISCRQHALAKPDSGRISARKIDIKAVEPAVLTPQRPTCSFCFKVFPENATDTVIDWQVTNAAGIETPFVQLTKNRNRITVTACSDGQYYLRALCREDNRCIFISQTEFSASGFGKPALNPFSYICAGLYDIHEGDIGTGNEKGIAFSRDGESMIGFTSVDFGQTGSDVITVDIFALDGNPYEIELWASSPGTDKRLIDVLHYEKPSIWNVYQPETWKLQERLRGINTICFRMKNKVHMKGFVFEKQQNAYLRHMAGSADSVYGDCYQRSGDSITGIGNNVTLTWSEMDFGRTDDVISVEIEGKTTLPMNTICIRIRNEQGEEKVSAADFYGQGGAKQTFRIHVPSGICKISFVFMPGSLFDFHAFRFYRPENWTDSRE